MGTPNRIYGSTAYLLFLISFILFALPETNKAEWVSHGGDTSNTRSRVYGEPKIRRSMIDNLKLRWKFMVGNDVTATPAVSGGVVYFPAWDGNLYAVRALDGALVWKVNLTQLTGLSPPPLGAFTNKTISRTTPAIAGRLLIIGIYGPAAVVAIDRFTASKVWMTIVDPLPLAQITMSGIIYNDGFYVGVSSSEEGLPAGRCCTFRGSLAKLHTLTGSILWQTYTVPDNGGRVGGYSGGAVWGSSPSVDPLRGLVYIGTGNLYLAPASVLDCQARQNNHSSTSAGDQCVGPDVHFNSIMALDLRSGGIRWSRRFDPYDLFYFQCLVPNNPACPPGPNLDADFGEAPMMLTIRSPNGYTRDVVVAVQKSGFVWALDRTTGDTVWFKEAGPGGLEGGGVWGAATDGKTIFTNIVNSEAKPFRLAPSNRTTTSGGWVALDAGTGDIKWTTAVPNNETAHGPVTLVNGLLFAGSVAPSGPFYAMDGLTGEILWTFDTGATVYGGASVTDGCLYLGNGLSAGLAKFHPTWTRGTAVFAFCATKF